MVTRARASEDRSPPYRGCKRAPDRRFLSHDGGALRTRTPRTQGEGVLPRYSAVKRLHGEASRRAAGLPGGPYSASSNQGSRHALLSSADASASTSPPGRGRRGTRVRRPSLRPGFVSPGWPVKRKLPRVPLVAAHALAGVSSRIATCRRSFLAIFGRTSGAFRLLRTRASSSRFFARVGRAR